jgi:hypothetical protein
MKQCSKVYFQSNGQIKCGKELKVRIALDVIKGQKTIAELSSEYGVHVNQIRIWKKQLIDWKVGGIDLIYLVMFDVYQSVGIDGQFEHPKVLE